MEAVSALDAKTNLRCADDIDGEKVRGTDKIIRASRQSHYSLRHGDQCPEDEADDKQQHKNQSKRTKA